MSAHQGCSRIGIFEYQAPAVLNSACVQNEWLWILGTGTTGGAVTTSVKNVRVWSIAVNVEDTDETLEVQIIIDGETIQASAFVATNSLAYYMYINAEPIARIDRVLSTTQLENLRRTFIIDGREVAIAVRKTTAAGAGNLTGIVIYGVLRDA